MSTPCPLCGHAGGERLHVAREMMFGTGDAFTYVECAGCGALLLRDVPADLSRYYPPDYYSYADPPPRRWGGLRRWAGRRAADAMLGTGHVAGRLAGRLLLARFPAPPELSWMQRLGVGPDDPLLDVGCGGGALLQRLRALGFRDLTGIDPFLPADRDIAPGLRLRRRELADEPTGRYAAVMLHHVLEHLPDQAAALGHVRRLLRPGGRALVRIPLKDSEAWERYGVDWVQLDAPRHLVLHTRRSLELVAGRAGLRVVDVVWDSTAFQFWGSEQYRRGIPLRDPRSHAVDPAASPFSAEDLALYAALAAELNRRGRGDQAAFFLEPA